MNIIDKFKVIKMCFSKFPKDITSKNALDFLFKDNCPLCISHPLETLSNYEYNEKYPAIHTINFGATKICLCDYHLIKLKESFDEFDWKPLLQKYEQKEIKNETD